MGRVGCEAVPVDDGTESIVVEVVVVAGVRAAFIVEKLRRCLDVV